MSKTKTLLYPQSVLEPRTPDEMFREEAQAMSAAGHNIHLIDTDLAGWTVERFVGIYSDAG
ncbi:MAG TPA: hypothetical protein VJ810_31245 [Blastocatellia bacterium]|nr:hypothetical protein [Blastocatellia bacterium]